MGEYKITAIDESPPKEWKGPKGTIYYITVGLEGHEKPVGIGKKSPDALRIGDTVYGDIIDTEFDTDKWKHGERPEGQPTQVSKIASMPSKDKDYAKADYEPGTNARWAIGMAYRAYIQATNSPEGPDGNFPFDAVKQHASELIQMFDELKTGGSAGESTPSSANPTIKETSSATGYDKFQETGKAFKEEITEEDVPDFDGGEYLNEG